MKKIIFLGLVVVTISFFVGCNQELPIEPQKASYIIEREINNDVEPYLSFSYDCEDIGKSVKCDGLINYIGDSDYKISGAKLLMYCYKETSTGSECTVGSDSVSLGEMDSDRNQLPFTLKCDYNNHKNFKVKLHLTSGVTVLPSSC